LADLPVLGRFFSMEHVEKNRGELLIALIPHIVRFPDITDVNVRGVAAGTDQNLKLNYAPRQDYTPPAATTGPAATPQGTTPPSTATPATDLPATPIAPVQPRLIFNPETASVQLNAPVSLQLVLENVTELYTAPVKLKFDPKVLRLTSIKPGPLMSADGQRANFTESTMNDTGDATITLNRIPGTGGVSGSGPILDLTFQAIGKGASPVTITDAGVKNLQLQPIAVSAPSMTITVQ
jgi:general secretion pathway protein D